MEHAAHLLGVIPMAAAAVRRHPSEQCVVRNGVWFLNGVAMSEEHRAAVASELPTVMGALTANLGDGDATHAAVSYLCWLSRSPETLEVIRAWGEGTGVREAVARAMEAQPGVPEVMRWGAEVMGKL